MNKAELGATIKYSPCDFIYKIMTIIIFSPGLVDIIEEMRIGEVL